ncbi:hypothetical protein INR49_023050 [Caranx melampygus]|nr:hypothetical protein INR49_023050 [Caranx melampygus]
MKENTEASGNKDGKKADRRQQHPSVGQEAEDMRTADMSRVQALCCWQWQQLAERHPAETPSLHCHYCSGSGTLSRREEVWKILPDELVDEQILVGQRRPGLPLVIQGAEHLCPNTSLQLAEHTAGLQRVSHG